LSGRFSAGKKKALGNQGLRSDGWETRIRT
jgi:hypothetical protein